MRRWYTTDLSVRSSDPALLNGRAYRVQLGADETRAMTFDAEEAADTVAATLRRLDTGELVMTDDDPPVDWPTADLLAEIATVTIPAGLRRGIDYELAVTFTDSNDVSWTRTLILECVN